MNQFIKPSSGRGNKSMSRGFSSQRVTAWGSVQEGSARPKERSIMTRTQREFDLFLATPMSAYTDPEDYARVRDVVVRFYMELKSKTKLGRVFCPALELADATKFDPDEHALVEDFLALEESEAFVMFYLPPLPQRPSSVYVEAGMALKAR